MPSPTFWCAEIVTSAGSVAAVLRAQHLVDRRQRRLPLEEAVLEHPVVVVELREVVAAGVGDHRQHALARRRAAARSARRRTRVVPPEPPARMPSSRASRRAQRNESRSRDADPLVDDLRVHRLRPRVLADALDEIRMEVVVALRRVHRAFRVGADDQHLRLALLEVAPDAADRAAGADGDDDRVDLAAVVCSQISGPVDA